MLIVILVGWFILSILASLVLWAMLVGASTQELPSNVEAAEVETSTAYIRAQRRAQAYELAQAQFAPKPGYNPVSTEMNNAATVEATT